MNEADRKRVPECGWIWCEYTIHGSDFTVFPHDTDLEDGDMTNACCIHVPNEMRARQIVGSVNAAILRYRHGWPSTKRPLSDEGRQIESDIDFWTHYAFASVQP